MTSPENTPESSVHVGEPDRRGKRLSPWGWVLGVNYVQGLQYILVTQLAIIIWYTMGVSPTASAFWANLLSLPWTLKPLWGPLVDRYWTKRNWTIVMQLVVGLCMLGCAVAMTLPIFFQLTLLFLGILAFAAATHDIACDGFFMLALTEKQQAFFVGVRSTCFRLGWITAASLLPLLANFVQNNTGPDPVYVQARAVPTLGEEWPEDNEPEEGEEASAEAGPRIVVEPRRVEMPLEGGSATMFVRLDAPPEDGKSLVLITTVDEGSKSISVNRAEGRLEFTSANWDQPTTVTVTVDKKQTTAAAATLRVAAGNLPVSWMVAFGTAGFIVIAAFGLHTLTMPYPVQDEVDLVDRPPFYVPLLALLATLALPVAYFWVLGAWFGRELSEPLKAAIHPPLLEWLQGITLAPGRNPETVALSGFNFLFNLIRVSVLLGGVAILLAIPPIRTALGRFFYKMSDVSRIGFADVFVSFFQKPGMMAVVGFLLTYRLGEIQISTISNIFLLAPRSEGGLALNLDQWSLIKGFFYVIALLIGGILGGFTISRYGLARCIWPFTACIHLPNLTYVYMALALPDNLWISGTCVFIEAFGYGLGLPAFLFVMIKAAEGPYKTSHYALCTGFMSLGAMIPGMFSGFLSDTVGYPVFFILVMVFCIPGLIFIPFLPIYKRPEVDINEIKGASD